MKCEHLNDILEAEISIIKEHTNSRKEVNDYIKKHGEQMRALYCGNVCPDRYSCELAKKYIHPKE